MHRFNYVVIASDSEGYYYDDWSKAIPVAVEAATEAEALKEVWAIRGPAPRGRFWKARLRSVEPVGTAS